MCKNFFPAMMATQQPEQSSRGTDTPSVMVETRIGPDRRAGKRGFTYD